MILKEIQLKNIRSYTELVPFQFLGGHHFSMVT